MENQWTFETVAKLYKSLFYFWQHASLLPSSGLVVLNKSGLDKISSDIKSSAIVVELLFDIRNEQELLASSNKTSFEIYGKNEIPLQLMSGHKQLLENKSGDDESFNIDSTNSIELIHNL